MNWIIKAESGIVGTLPAYLCGSVRMHRREHATKFKNKADADRFAAVVASNNSILTITVEEL